MRPCGGRTEVLRVLTEEGHLGHAEDVATQSFEREKARDRWRVAISVCGGDSGGPIYESSYSDGVYTYRAISIIARGATSATGPRFNSVVRNQFSAYKRYRDGENVPYCCF